MRHNAIESFGIGSAAAIKELTELGEPEVFAAYREKWDAAAAVIVPMVRQAQTANGIELYTPEQYGRNRNDGTEEPR